jgi:hypothetical protein
MGEESDCIAVDAIDDLVSDRIYCKKELLEYLQSGREKYYHESQASQRKN